MHVELISAPLNPSVREARFLKLIPAPRGLFCKWIAKISLRSLSSGSGISTISSKRPGLEWRDQADLSGWSRPDQNPFQLFHPIQFREELARDALGHMRIRRTGAAGGHESVNLVEEDNAGCSLARFAKYLAHALLRFPHIFRKQFRPFDRDEIHLRFAGHRFGEEGFSAAWGTQSRIPLGAYGSPPG